MGFPSKIKLDSFDRKREAVCAHLQAMGIEAQIAERGRPEEVFREPGELSLGLIYLYRQAINWINVVEGFTKAVRMGGQLYHRLCYGVQDPNLRIEEPRVWFRSIRQRSWWPLGRVVDLSWQDMVGPVRLYPLSGNELLKERLIKEGIDVEVVGYPDGYWLIANREGARLPSKGMWECYQAIALDLLESGGSLKPRRTGEATTQGYHDYNDYNLAED